MKTIIASLLTALTALFSAFVYFVVTEDKGIEFRNYCKGVEDQEHPDFKNRFHECDYHGIRVNSQCRAVSVGNATNPEYILYCESKEPLQTRSIPTKEFQQP